MDSLVIKGIRFHGHHGVTEEERTIGGHYEVDVTLNLSLLKAGKYDTLVDTIDYESVVNMLVEIATSQKFKLIEALAEKMTDEILNKFDIDAIQLTIKKLKPPINNPITYFAVEIYREKE